MSQSGTPARSSSLIQLRGSIPLFWSHPNLFSPKPDIRIEELDSDYDATRRHFHDIFSRYGPHLSIINLVKQIESKAREISLGVKYLDSVSVLCERVNYSDSFKAKSYSKLRFTYDVSKLSLFEEPSAAADSDVNSDINSPSSWPSENSPSRDSSTSYESRRHRDAYGSRLSQLTSGIPVNYITYDFLNAEESRLFSDLEQICEGVFEESGFFVQAPNREDKYFEFPLTSHR